MTFQWDAYYEPPKAWKGRIDGPLPERIHQVVQCINLKEPLSSLKSGTFSLIGFACDEGVSRNFGRTGAKKGPESIRSALASMPLKKEIDKLYDFGDVICPNHNLEESQQTLSILIEKLHKLNLTPIILGGGHEVAWGHFQGLSKAYPDQSIGILNLDSHFDLRPLIDGKKGSSGTPFLQIAHDCHKNQKDFHYMCIGIQRVGNTASLFERAKQLNVSFIEAGDIHSKGIEAFIPQIKQFIEHCDILYLTLCLDVLAAPFAPGVSAPQPLGLYPQHVLNLLNIIFKSNKLITFEIAELNPTYDQDKITAKLAASFALNYMCNLKFS